MPDYDKECFVVGAIGEEDSPERIHADWLLEEIVEPVFAENWPDFAVVRADRISTPGLIDAQIIDRLLNDRVVIADLTFLNPNAFYELGIRHVMQKPVVHVHRAGEKIPFDVSLFRSMKFSVAQPKHVRLAKEELTKLLKAVLAKDHQVENPVTKARGRVQFEQTASSPDRVLQGEVEALSRRMLLIEESLAPLSKEAIWAGNTLRRLTTAVPYAAVSREVMTFYTDDPTRVNQLADFRARFVEGLVGEGFALDNIQPKSFEFSYPPGQLLKRVADDLVENARLLSIRVKRSTR